MLPAFSTSLWKPSTFLKQGQNTKVVLLAAEKYGQKSQAINNFLLKQNIT